MTRVNPAIGIDDMACYVPPLYLDIQELAEVREIPFEKLSKGLGLHKMGLLDVHEDSATMAAEAIYELMAKNDLKPEDIGRLYMGTESTLDDAKPTATYAAEMVEEKLGGSFRHCDVVEMTFACIGGVDALQICLDWVGAEEGRKAIVVASDFAKYELESTGEYTQGAGAVAMLVQWQPRLLVIPRTFGVAMKSEHDFFKPIRATHTETPVFDGQFSNQCYQDRMNEAMADFRRRGEKAGVVKKDEVLDERWERLVFHLPYAFHGKRIYVDTFVSERKQAGTWDGFKNKYKLEEPTGEDAKAQRAFTKAVSQSGAYRDFVNTKLEKAQRASGQLGNLYAASIFLALMSTLESDAKDNSDLAGKRLGFVGYGSGSKSKIFEAEVQDSWHEVAKKFKVFNKLEERKKVSYAEYETLHKRTATESVDPRKGRFGLTSIGTEGPLTGARYYGII